jgi:hypothetical protein
MIKPKVLSVILIIFIPYLFFLGGCSPQTTPVISDNLGSNILARAKIWVDAKVEYGSFDNDPTNDYYDDYRTDCSGFVSYAWALLPTPGPDTSSFVRSGYASNISISELQPGDALNNQRPGSDGHIILFVKWIDKSNHTFTSYDLNTNPGYAAEKSFTLIQIPNSSDWTINELDQYAQGPYQAQRLISTKSAIIISSEIAPTPISSTIAAGNAQSVDCNSVDTLDRSNRDAVLNWMIDLINTGKINHSACLINNMFNYVIKTEDHWFGSAVLPSIYLEDLDLRISSSSIQCIGYYKDNSTQDGDLDISILTKGWSPAWNIPIYPELPYSDDFTFILSQDEKGIYNLEGALIGSMDFIDHQWTPCY